MTEQNETEQNTPSTPPDDRWVLPPEPEPGTVIAGQGHVWTRRRGSTGWGWHRAGSDRPLSWATVLTDAPLARLVPADDPRDDGPALAAVQAERDELLRTVDSLRNTVFRYRGTPAMRAAARRVVSTRGAAHEDAITRLGRVLDEADLEPRTVTYDRSAIVDGMAADAGLIPERSTRTAVRDLIALLPEDSVGMRWLRSLHGTAWGTRAEATLADVVNALRMNRDDPSTEPTLARAAVMSSRRRDVVRAARRVHESWIHGSAADIPTERWSALHDALAMLDGYIGEAV